MVAMARAAHRPSHDRQVRIEALEVDNASDQAVRSGRGRTRPHRGATVSVTSTSRSFGGTTMSTCPSAVRLEPRSQNSVETM